MTITALDAATYAAWMQENDGIIIFHKKLCPNCKVMHGVLNKVLLQDPSLKLASIDTEEQESIIAEFGVDRAPTLVVCKGGAVKAKQVGLIKPVQVLDLYRTA